LLGGGVGGNEQLTAATGVVLIVLLAVLGVTILRSNACRCRCAPAGLT